MLNLRELIEGWRNNLIPPKHLKQAINRIAKERMAICRMCEFNSKNSKESFLRPDEHCLECLCTLSAKTKCLSCHCPKDKWKALLSLEEEMNINYEKEINS